MAAVLPAVRPVQIAYHVPDPAAAAIEAARTFGWGPFFLFEHIPLQSCHYRGRASAFDHSSAYGQAGELMVEFITQHGDEPSVVRDVYRGHERGIHHVAHFVPGLEEAVAGYGALGFETAMDAVTRDGVRFAMLDTRATLGHLLELYEPGPGLTRFYDYVRRKAQGWDGHEPLRRLGA